MTFIYGVSGRKVAKNLKKKKKKKTIAVRKTIPFFL